MDDNNWISVSQQNLKEILAVADDFYHSMREEFTEDLQEIILMQLDLKQETQQECQVCEAKSSKSSYNITTESPQKNSNCFNVRNKDKKTWQ
ncbi:8717_t:CDS:2 [Funneliformis geosporum]|nr:8717_t:CDS:2 [Funneliformis geosporum]